MCRHEAALSNDRCSGHDKVAVLLAANVCGSRLAVGGAQPGWITVGP